MTARLLEAGTSNGNNRSDAATTGFPRTGGEGPGPRPRSILDDSAVIRYFNSLSRNSETYLAIVTSTLLHA